MPEATDVERQDTGLEIAVIGMAGRFPSAGDLDEFWDNLVDGVDAISRFTDDELRAAGVPDDALDDRAYVRAKGVFPGLEHFDAGFFNYTPADATMLDPQVRALHQEVFHALEDAGYSADGRGESIGLFLGATNNFAWESHTLIKYVQSADLSFSSSQLNDKDYAATRIAYALDLKGPALTLHTACSSSLVAIDMACRTLWTGGCQLAVAGGSGLTLPHKNGYRYQENMIHSPDGHCRAFDQGAGGTVEGNGAGAVVLKRLETALRDGDRVYAVIKGSAVNNDGNRKVGYTAPSIEGQAEVIRKAYRVAGVAPAEVSYVEAHGTGTALGDPVEFEALSKAFDTSKPGTVGLGSLKASIGHLDTAAGVASFIKTCKVLERRRVPRSPHFAAPNENIGFIDSPFYVVDRTEELTRKRVGDKCLPLRAGVSSFGIGGSNAHLVLEEPPVARPTPDSGRAWNTFVVSATSEAAIQRIKQDFADHLGAHPELRAADLAWTLQNRQRRLAHRYAVEFTDAAQLRERLLASLAADEPPARLAKNARRDVYFLFSGSAAKHLRMAHDLYLSEDAFRGHLDACFEASEAMGDGVPREVFLGDSVAAEKQLDDLETSELVLFMVEYALAKTLIGWGLKPRGMVGHDTGELAAACVAEVFSLEDGIRLVRARGRLLDTTTEGALTAVRAAEDVVRPLLTRQLAIAAVNSPQDCVVSGTPGAVAAFEKRCAERGVDTTRLEAGRAGHSRHVDGVLPAFREVVEQVALRPPKIPFASNVTGTWITQEQAVDPGYYTAQVRDTVRFKDGVEAVMERGDAVFVEVGPGGVLSAFARAAGAGTAIPVLRDRADDVRDDEHLARAVRLLWEAGVALDWKAFHRGREPRKVALPAYPFDKVEYPVDVSEFQRLRAEPDDSAEAAPVAGPKPLLRLAWSALPAPVVEEQPKVLVVFTDDAPKLRRLLDHIPHWRALYVTYGQSYEFHGSGAVVRDHHDEDLRRLVDDLREHALTGDTFVVHRDSYASAITLTRRLGALAAGMAQRCVTDVVVLDTGDFLATRPDFLPRLLGLNHEHPEVRVRAFRGDPARAGGDPWRTWAGALRAELETPRPDAIAVRHEGGRRMVPTMAPVPEHRAGRAGRTALLCPAEAVEDVAAALGEHGRGIQVVPFALRSDAAPTNTGGGRVAVLPVVTGGTWNELSAALSARVRELPSVDALVVWDVRDGGGVDRRALFGLATQVAGELRASCHVVGRPGPDRGWDSGMTGWLADNELVDAKFGLTRLYAFDTVVGPVPDLFRRMAAAGVRTAYHGVDPLAARKTVLTDDGSGDGSDDEHAAVVTVIEATLAKLLGFAEVNTRANMMELGLDSVKLVQFTNALERHDLKVLLADVYNHPTVDGLAGLLVSRAANEAGEDGATPDSIAAGLSERLGRACAFHEFPQEQDPLILLFVEGLDGDLDGDPDDDLRPRVIRELNDLRVPHGLAPHYILPRAVEERFLAERTFESLGVGAAAGDGDPAAVFAEIDRGQEELRAAIGAQPVKWTYPISGMQKQHFASEARLQLYLIQFRRLVDVEVLRRAMTDVVGRHGLMRSFLAKARGKFRWKEFDAPAALPLPSLDLSRLAPEQQARLRDELIEREWSVDFKTADRPMYQVVLIKYNERHYDLLFQFDHSIFDATSGQTLRGDLLRRYEELVAGTARAMPVAKSYRHLRDQITKGPVGITAEEIVERFELERYARCTKAVQDKAAAHADARVQAVRYSVDLADFPAGADGEVEPFSLVVHLYARVVARLMEVEDVALNILFGSRVFEDQDYSDVMGMVLGGMPAVVSGQRGAKDDLDAVITDKVRVMNQNNVSFLDLVHDLKSLVRYRKVLMAVKDVMGGRSTRLSCLVNFVGNVEDEYDAVWDLMLEQLDEDQGKLDYADCYCNAKINNGRLDLLVLCKWVQDPQEIRVILDEEVEYLTGRAATTSPAARA
ncbi:beta-ketoacyl synthase N-terminal-like domain-containing protein [Actinokineospora sp. G85]|uniref:beta-ketoacyl synthase N-terminal-like domain-containing protein n=1 Tax=Actinokineospora sp. G85 TaxID=3406626 RepID=UPI003C72A450